MFGKNILRYDISGRIKIMENQEFFECETFTLELDGKEVELAITEEFDFEDNHYVLCAEVEGDMLKEDEGLYLFRAISEGDDITVETIETIDAGFEYSDHNPVYIQVSFK